MIVWLASYPRSGNTYFRMLLYHLYGIKTSSVYNDPLFQRIGASELIGHELLLAPLEELANEDKVYFVKTHGLPTDNGPAIYIVRDGRDAVVSYAKYELSFGQEPSRPTRLKEILGLEDRFQRILRDLILSNQDYGSWSRNVLSWTRCRKGGFTFSLRYENLILDPIYWVKNALDALQFEVLPIGGNLPSFDELHSKWPEFFRKGKVGSWREEMPEDLRSLFWEHHAEAMEAFGYRRD